MAGTRFSHYQLDLIGTVLNLPESDREPGVTYQFATWLSADGLRWGGANCFAGMVNTEPFRVTWHNGMGYVIGQWGKDMSGPLYRTRDGRTWRIPVQRFAPEGRCNEGALAFGRDGAAYCLFRDGENHVMLGGGNHPITRSGHGRFRRPTTAPKRAGRGRRPKFCERR